MRLYLVRHGATDAAGRCIGHCDVPLTAAGAAAIERARLCLPDRPHRLVASDLARAVTSAQLLEQHWHLPITRDPRLREMHFGEWEGRSWAELEQHDGARLRDWMADWVRVRAPSGESFEDVVARARAWLVEVQVAWRHETVVVVAHAGLIRAMLCLWLALPLEYAFHFRVDPASVSVILAEGAVADE